MADIEIINIQPSDARSYFIRLMAETLPLYGYDGIKADCEGFEKPEDIHGVVEDFSPAITCTGPKPLIMDLAFFDEEVDSTVLMKRWQLFASAANLLSGNFHIVVPSITLSGKKGKEVAKTMGDFVGIMPDKIWEI